MTRSRPGLPPLAAAVLLLAACGEQQPPRDSGAERAAPTDPGMAGEAAATGGAPADESTADQATPPAAPAGAEGARGDRDAADPVRDGVPPEPVPEGVPPATDVPPEVVREAPDTGAPPPARPTSDPTR